MQVICFEDQHVDQLSPIVHARPAYAITCASHRLIDWLFWCFGQDAGSGSIHGLVRSYLEVLQELDFKISTPSGVDTEGGVLLVNARLVPRVSLERSLRALAESSSSAAVFDSEDGSILAARICGKDLRPVSEREPTVSLIDALESAARGLPRWEDAAATEFQVFRFPHDVVAHHMTSMGDAMQWRIENGDYVQQQDGVFVRSGVSIGDHASIHTEDGPIILEEGVKIGPFCFLEGPLYAGAGTRVLEHAAIKDGVSLGHTVKIGGEVEASIIEGFTNKQHHGFLGHSYLGSWINLGAGTCNSDLKNTYGKINIEYGDRKIATGMQFLGCIMGDYSKTAINTGIFTGKVIGVCSMLYGFVTGNVPSYVNYARLFGQTSLLPAEVMVNTQQRMFARRKVEQRECDKQLIVDMYQRTEPEREAQHLGL